MHLRSVTTAALLATGTLLVAGQAHADTTDPMPLTDVSDAPADIGTWSPTSPRSREQAQDVQFGVLAGISGGLGAGISTGGMLIELTLPIGISAGLAGGLAAANNSQADPTMDGWAYTPECHTVYGFYEEEEGQICE